MTDIANIVLSIFGLIGIGYGAARTGLLGKDVGKGLADFVFTIAIPVLLFKTLATADFGIAAPWSIWSAYFAGAAVTWALSHVTIRRMFGRDARAGLVAGLSGSYANTVLIGIPLVQTAFGEAGMVSLLIIVAVHLPVMMLASLIMFEWALRVDGVQSGTVDRGAILRRFVDNMARNPLVIAILAGAIWRLADLPLTGVPAILTDALSRAAGPVALFSAGMGLASYGIARNVHQALVITAFKLVVMPAIVLASGWAIGLAPLAVATATLAAACPTGVNPYLIAGRFGTGEAIASNAIAISTAAGFITVAIWLVILQRLLS
ncbi:MAG TPA: AEC family transporter [Afifellaceae bacterium]|nr:AEC family transporter [Afifellaceae bacterium]